VVGLAGWPRFACRIRYTFYGVNQWRGLLRSVSWIKVLFLGLGSGLPWPTPFADHRSSHVSPCGFPVPSYRLLGSWDFPSCTILHLSVQTCVDLRDCGRRQVLPLRSPLIPRSACALRVGSYLA